MNLETALKPWSLSSQSISSILEQALNNGGVFSELFFEKASATSVLLENGKLDQVNEGTDRGVGLRVISQGKTYYAYTTEVTEKALLRIAKEISEAIQTSRLNQNQGNEKKETLAGQWVQNHSKSKEIESYQVKKSMREVSLPEKVEIAKRIDQGARGVLPTAVQVTSVVKDALREILVINSQGEFGAHQKHYFQMIGLVVGQKNNRLESAHEVVGGFTGQELLQSNSPESIGEKAAERVKKLLDAVPAPSGTLPVVLSSAAGGTMIHEAVGHGLEADLACNGLSVYQGKLGQKVADTKVSVVDDGTLPELRGSYTVDDEGTPSQRNVLIEKGVLKNYMVDRLSALKFDIMATGNGRRESFRHKPMVRMTNTFIAPGTDEPEAILASTPKGVFIKSMGGGQVNTVSGDFVFSVTEGYLIRDGKLGEAIRGATLVGNGPKVLQLIDQVGDDLDFQPGTCGKDGQAAPVTSAQPTIRIKELTIGGEAPLSDYF